MLKDAYDFVCDGRKEGEIEGPWFTANKSLMAAKGRLERARDDLAGEFTSEDLAKNEDELIKARAVLDKQNRLLKNKVRTIELVKALSDKFSS